MIKVVVSVGLLALVSCSDVPYNLCDDYEASNMYYSSSTCDTILVSYASVDVVPKSWTVETCLSEYGNGINNPKYTWVLFLEPEAEKCCTSKLSKCDKVIQWPDICANKDFKPNTVYKNTGSTCAEHLKTLSMLSAKTTSTVVASGWTPETCKKPVTEGNNIKTFETYLGEVSEICCVSGKSACPEDKNEGLSVGAIIGIVVGSVALFCCGVLGGLYYVCKARKADNTVGPEKF